MGKFRKNLHNKFRMNSNYILGTRVDSGISQKNFRELFFKLLQKGNSKIFTINPEFIVDSFFDNNFQRILNTGDYNSIDGFGVSWEILKRGKKSYNFEDISKQVFTGVDITYNILDICNKDSLSVFLLGGSLEQNSSKKVSDFIHNKYPKIKVVGYSSDFSHSEKDDKETLKFIHKEMKACGVKQIDIVFVAYGHKNQENWIVRNQNKIPASICIGVGGTFEYLSNNISRAPLVFRKVGLEWLYRLLTQPSRIFRIIKAVILFPILVAFLEKKATN